ncbi:MAG: biopolymer transporter ExbD [Deltaproteobacteria bacterium]|nr:biopolymer transporter ExbD [Deltaproteobacteria bacterium]
MSANEPLSDLLPADAHAFDRYAGRPKRRGKFKLPGEEVTGLNLTAMMDMMTILLVFLVKSYSTDPERVQVSDTLHPPSSTSSDEVLPAVNITVTSEAIMVEEIPVATLDTLSANQQESAFIPALSDALTRRVEELKELERLGGAPFDGAVLVVAHKDTPYDLLTTVLYTAGQAQFSQYRLLVMKAEDKAALEAAE